MEIPNRTDYDAAFARKLSRLNARQRRELITLLGHPPNIANVPPSFWEKVRKENENELAAALLLLFAESFFFHARAAAVDPGRDRTTNDPAGRAADANASAASRDRRRQRSFD